MTVLDKVLLCLFLIFVTWFGFQIYNGLNYIPCCGDDFLLMDNYAMCECKFINESGHYYKYSLGCTNCSNCSWQYVSNVSEEYWLNYSMEICLNE